MKAQLLCTFSNIDSIFNTVKVIKNTYENNINGIVVYSYADSPSSVVCIYNVVDTSKRLKDTISINKKKETNTYYSINALNALIMALNNGTLDKSYKINWSDYNDSLLLSNGPNGYRHIRIQSVSSF